MNSATNNTLKDVELRMFLKSLAWFALAMLVAGGIAWYCIRYQIWP